MSWRISWTQKHRNSISSIRKILRKNQICSWTDGYSLFALNDFRHSLRDSVRTYIERYTTHEKGFYLYRKLMYKMLHEIIHRKSIEIVQGQGGVQVDFGENE